MAITYTLFIVPFCIAFEYELEVWVIPFDVLSLIIFIVDLPLSFNKDKMEFKLVFDLLAVVPLDYILLPLNVS